MASFESFTQFEQYFDEILEIMEDFSSPVYVSPKIIDGIESGSESRLSSSLNVSLSAGETRPPTTDQENIQVIKFGYFILTQNIVLITNILYFQMEPCHILCIAMKDTHNMEDDKLGKMYEEFCQQHREELKKRSIRRITFLALNK